MAAHASPLYVDIVSDLHAEFGAPAVTWPPDAKAVDLLMAGDIGKIADGSWIRAVAEAAALYRHVYAVLGNHEYYNAGRHTMAELEVRAREQVAALFNVTLLQRESAVTADGLRILGCTLWSDTRGDEATVGAMMNDYKRMWVAGDNGHGSSRRKATPRDTSEAWDRDVAWLAGELAKGEEPVLVLTHHGPHPLCNPPAYAGSGLTCAFVSHVPLPRAAVLLSVSGHTHGRQRVVTEEGVPCFSWCLGYPGELQGPCAPLRVNAHTGQAIEGGRGQATMTGDEEFEWM